MRQIDNMTPQEIDTLALKGMTAPRTSSERRHAFIEKHGVTGGTLESREPTPNKAQHSPLPWRTVVETDFEPCAVCSNDGEEIVHLVGGSRSERATNAKLIVRAVNHADKLAEQLRECAEAMTHASRLTFKTICE